VFEQVHTVDSTSALRDMIKGGTLPKEKQRLTFVFASDLRVDTAESLEYLVGRLSSAGWRVVILGTSPLGKDIVYAHPAAGYLEGPFTVNQLLGALAGLGFTGLEPVADGFDAVYPHSNGSTAAWTNAAQPAPTGAWVRPAETTAPAVVQPSPQPAHQPAPAAPQRAGVWTPAATPEPNIPTDRAPAPTPVARPAVAPLTPTPQPTAPQPARSLARPGAAPPQTAPGDSSTIARPGQPGPIGRRVGTYQDFAPSGPSARRRGYVITIASPKGGTGKSSLSANLAVYLGLSLRGTGKRVCLIDANFQQADTGKLLNVYFPNITQILKEEGSMVPERIEQYMVERPNLNTSFLLGPATPRDGSPVFFNSRLYLQVLEVLKQNFDYILIDTPVAELYHDILRGFALPAADYIVAPITPAIHTLMNAEGWLRSITQPRHQGGDEIDPEKIGIVLNQAQDGVDCDEEQVRRDLFAWRFIGSVPMTTEWLRSINNNEFVATKNIPVINEAFANILFAATREELLLRGMATGEESTKKGLLGKLRRRR
jgi:cellulose biosynthesis protein BcsQ